MNFHLIFVPFLLFVVNIIESAKVLFICPVPTRSHQKIYAQLWIEMSLRGHEVHAVTPNPINNSTLTNLTEYDISGLYDTRKRMPQNKVHNFFQKSNFLTMITRQYSFKYFIFHGMKDMANFASFKQLIKTQKSFDVCIVEWMFPFLAIYSHIFKCKLIGVSSAGVQIPMLDFIGNPSHPIMVPDHDLPLSKDVNGFYEKLWSTIWTVFTRVYYKFILLPDIDSLCKKLYGFDIPYIEDLQRNISLLILNRNIAFHRPAANLPNVIEIGGFKQQPVYEKMLHKDLQDFLDQSSNGIIYFSLGSSMMGQDLPEDKLKIIQTVFERLPFTILWKWENSSMFGKPENVYISKWFPQVNVLEHPNVKLFITQGGLQSIEETIAANKPIIGIPFHSDQTTNIDTCVKYGMGKMLDLSELTEDKLRRDIVEIVNDTNYTKNAKYLNDLMKDQPQDGLDKAIWWIEYVIRHNGAQHLKSSTVDLPWWKYLLFDVFGFILGILFLILLVVKYVFRGAVIWIEKKLKYKKID